MTVSDTPRLAAAPREDRPYGDDTPVPQRSFARRAAYAVAITVVAVDAALNSYAHIVAVALHAKQDPFLAYSLPLSVDGMLLVATLAIAEDKANNRRPRGWARFAFWLGAVVSIAANMASEVVDNGMDPLSLAVSAWPPIALLVVVEIMARPGKPRIAPPDAPAFAGQPATAAVVEAPVSDPGAAGEPAPVDGRLDGAVLDSADVAAVADMIAVAREAAAELAEQGRPLSRESLSDMLRERGHAISNARASTLLKIVKARASS